MKYFILSIFGKIFSDQPIDKLVSACKTKIQSPQDFSIPLFICIPLPRVPSRKTAPTSLAIILVLSNEPPSEIINSLIKFLSIPSKSDGPPPLESKSMSAAIPPKSKSPTSESKPIPPKSAAKSSGSGPPPLEASSGPPPLEESSSGLPELDDMATKLVNMKLGKAKMFSSSRPLMANGKKVEDKTPSILNNFANPDYKEDVENGDDIDEDCEDGDANDLY